MTPVLALLLLGARIPVDARGMALSITQIVLVPVLAGDLPSAAMALVQVSAVLYSRKAHAAFPTGSRLGTYTVCSALRLSQCLESALLICALGLAGLTCSTYFPAFVARSRPFLTFASLLDTCACVGASLASNSATARSAMGLAVLLPVSRTVLPPSK